MPQVSAEVWLCIDNDGCYEVGCDADEARSRYEENVGALADADGFRLVRLGVTIPAPEPISVEVDVPDEEPAATVAVS